MKEFKIKLTKNGYIIEYVYQQKVGTKKCSIDVMGTFRIQEIASKDTLEETLQAMAYSPDKFDSVRIDERTDLDETLPLRTKT